jgi:hypothetical protein
VEEGGNFLVGMKLGYRYLWCGEEGEVSQEAPVLLLEAGLGKLTRSLEDISWKRKQKLIQQIRYHFRNS